MLAETEKRTLGMNTFAVFFVSSSRTAGRSACETVLSELCSVTGLCNGPSERTPQLNHINHFLQIKRNPIVRHEKSVADCVEATRQPGHIEQGFSNLLPVGRTSWHLTFAPVCIAAT